MNNPKHRIFSLKLTYQDLDDSFHFYNPPTKQDCRNAVNAHAELAGEQWEFLYKVFDDILETINWTDTRPSFESNLAVFGGPGGEECTYLFSALNVIQN